MQWKPSSQARRAGLVWLFYPEYGDLRELVAGGVGTLLANGALTSEKHRVIRSTATTNGGISFGWSTALEWITRDVTILVGVALNNASSFGALWGVPHAIGTWVDPWYCLGYLRDSSSGNDRFHYARSGGYTAVNGASLPLSYDGVHRVYGVTRAEAAVNFYKDGVVTSSPTLGTNSDVNWGNKVGVTLLERSASSTGEGTQGNVRFAAVFNRALPAGEIARFSLLPSELVSRTLWVGYSAPGGPPPPPPPPSPPPAPPVASFVVNTGAGVVPLTVNFTNMSQGAITEYRWDFNNDGIIDSSTANTSYTFTTVGVHEVRLTVVGPSGSHSASQLITVTPYVPAGVTNAQEMVVQIDWDGDGDFDDLNENITPYVMRASWNLGFRRPFMTVADETECELIVRNTDRRFSPENANSPLYGKMLPQRQIRIGYWDGAAVQALYTGWLEMVQPTPGERGELQAMITGVGAKKNLQDTTLYLPLMENVTADEVIQRILRQVQLPPAAGKVWILGAPGYSELGVSTRLPGLAGQLLETGQTRFSYVGDTWSDGVSAWNALYDVVDGERGKFFFDRAGNAVFWNRQHMQLFGTAVATFNNQQMNLVYDYGSYMANVVEVTLSPRKISTGDNDVLYQLDKPIELRRGEQRKMRVQFVGDEGARIAGKNVLVPSGADFAATGGISINGFEATATSAEMTLVGGEQAGSVTTLIIRGKKLTAYNRETITMSDGVNVALYGRKVLRIEAALLDNRDTAESIAHYELTRRKLPMGTIISLSIMNRDVTYKAQQKTLTVGSRIRVIEAQTGHDAEYIIVGEAHSLRDGLLLWETRYALEAVDRSPAWILSKPGYSELGNSTRVGL